MMQNHPPGSGNGHGRRRPAISGTAGSVRDLPACQHAAFHAPAEHDCPPDVSAADRDRGRVDHLPGPVLDLSVNAEQGTDQIPRPGQFLLSAKPRHLLDGDRAISDLCPQCRVLQGADRSGDRPPRQQFAEQGSAQVARHAARALGHSARAVDARMVVVVRSDPQRVQLDHQGVRRQRDSLVERSLLGALQWYGAPFFLIMYLAALKSVPEQLYEAAEIDGANAWQRFMHITLPMMRNIIAITVLFSLIVTFANFDIVQIMTAGGPRNMTHVFATYAFLLGIRSGDLPRGAATSLFMFPILAVAAIFILRGVPKRRRDIG